MERFIPDLSLRTDVCLRFPDGFLHPGSVFFPLVSITLPPACSPVLCGVALFCYVLLCSVVFGSALTAPVPGAYQSRLLWRGVDVCVKFDSLPIPWPYFCFCCFCFFMLFLVLVVLVFVVVVVIVYV